MEAQDQILVETERVRAVFQHAPVTLLVVVINALLTAFVLAAAVNPWSLGIWVGLMIAVSSGRWLIRRRFRGRMLNKQNRRLWIALSVSGALMTGILWGVGASVMSPADNTYQLFFAFVIGGMCAGTTAVNSAHLPTVLAFILPASLPLAIRLLIEGSPPLHISAVMVVIFAASLCVTSLQAHRAFGERIRLQLAFSRQDSELSSANTRLRGEIASRESVEATLHQAQKIDAIGQITGGIAHDFNNLLQVISGNLSMIGRLTSDNPKILGYVQAAEQAASQGAYLTGTLLAFARRQSPQVKRVSINALLHEFQPILLRASGDSIRFQTFLAPDLPDCIIDPALFQSAVLNLVINARDAMAEGGQLSIRTGVRTLRQEDLHLDPDAKPGRFVTVSVQDTGTGMTAEVLAQVFEPFFTTKDVGKGSGLGLSQVYGFARQSGGTVQLRSEPGAGTCVTLCLPAAGD